MGIIMQSNAQMIDLRKTIKQQLEAFKTDYPGVNFYCINDQTRILDYSISNLQQELLIGCLLAICLVFIFLGNYIAPLIIAITVPVSLIISIFLFKVFNVSINIISLAGLILGVGIMVDNSIIVIENIIQYKNNGFPLEEACIKGTGEIIKPLLTSLLTTCSIFVPLTLLSGISGAIFGDEALAIAIGLTTSFTVSITLLPTLMRLFYKGSSKYSRQLSYVHRIDKITEATYEYGVKWVFANKLIAMIILLCLLIGAGILYNYLPKEKFAATNNSETLVKIDWNENISVHSNSARVKELMQPINTQTITYADQCGKSQFIVGNPSVLESAESEIYISSEHQKDILRVQRYINQYINKRFPHAAVSFRSPEGVFDKIFNSDEADVVCNIKSNTAQHFPLTQPILDIEKECRSHFGDTVLTGKSAIVSNLLIEVNPVLLSLYNLRLTDIYNFLSAKLYGWSILKVDNNHNATPVVLKLDGDKKLRQILEEDVIRNAAGVDIPLRTLIQVKNRNDYKYYYGGKSGNFVPLHLTTGQPDILIDSLQKWAKQQPLIDVSFEGKFLSNRILIKEMILVFIVSILLLYFILAAQFESFIQPIIILLEIPIDLAGAFLLLFLFGRSIDLMAMIGIIVMCGIVINDSILKIDTINKILKQKADVMTALLEGGHRRLKPILMTSLTSMLSTLPIFWNNDMGSKLQVPYALTLIGGIFLGTIISLFFIPLIYWLIFNRRH